MLDYFALVENGSAPPVVRYLGHYKSAEDAIDNYERPDMILHVYDSSQIVNYSHDFPPPNCC